MEGFFNLPKARIKHSMGTAFIKPDNFNLIEQEGVSTAEISSWNDSLQILYFTLNLLGYEAYETRFVLPSRKFIRLNLETFEISHSGTEFIGPITAAIDTTDDVVIRFKEIKKSDGKTLGVPLGHWVHRAVNQFGFEIFPPDPNGAADWIDGQIFLTAGFDNQNRRLSIRENIASPEYKAAMKQTAFVRGYKEVIGIILYNRIWRGTKFDTRRRPVLLERFSGQGIDYQALDPTNNTLPAGLLWMLNPEYWENNFEKNAPEIFEAAKITWTVFTSINKNMFDQLEITTRNEGVLSNVEIFGGELRNFELFGWQPLKNETKTTLDPDIAKKVAELFSIFSGVTQTRFDQMLSGVRKLMFKRNVILPHQVLDSLKNLSYIELLMTLINFGVWKVRYLPEFKTSKAMELQRALRARLDKGPREKQRTVSLSIYDWGPITITNELAVYDPETGVEYDAKDCFNWEFRQGSGAEPHILFIVAAPGVRISHIDKVPPYTKVEIFRVQDHGSITGWHSPINVATLTQSRPFGRMPRWFNIASRNLPDHHPYKNETDASKIHAFLIKYTQTGVILTYPTADFIGPSLESNRYQLQVKIDVDSCDPTQRFSFHIEQFEKNKDFFDQQPTYDDITMAVLSRTGFLQWVLVVHFTKGVKIEVIEQNPNIVEFGTIFGTGNGRNNGWVHYLFYQIDSVSTSGSGVTTGSPYPIRDRGALNAIPPIGHYLQYDKDEPKPEDRYQDGYDTSQKLLDKTIKLWPYPNIRDDVFDKKIADLKWDERIGAWLDETSHSIVYKPRKSVKPLLEHKFNPNTDQLETFIVGVSTLSPIASYTGKIPLSLTFQRMIFDMAIGFIPVVGDAADVAEYSYALSTGKDRWGQPISEFELRLMAAGMLPMVSSGALKGLSRILR